MITRPRRIEPRQFGLLADALGDTLETTIFVHLLRRGLCCAYVAGDPERFLGAIVQDNHAPGEPTAFGADPQILWELLQIVPGWECVEIVSIAHTYARTTRHADISVRTFAAWRGHAFATAAASIVAGCIQEASQTPVWSTGEDNWASLRVAQKLGFVEISRRTYVIPIADRQER